MSTVDGIQIFEQILMEFIAPEEGISNHIPTERGNKGQKIRQKDGLRSIVDTL